jgi:hypothetical protein
MLRSHRIKSWTCVVLFVQLTSKAHREPMIAQLSKCFSNPKQELCILMANWVTFLHMWGGREHEDKLAGLLNLVFSPL